MVVRNSRIVIDFGMIWCVDLIFIVMMIRMVVVLVNLLSVGDDN